MAVLYDMGEVVVGCEAHVSKINDRRRGMARGIHQLAESSIFVLLPAGLDHEVEKPAVQDGKEGIDVHLVVSARGFPAWLKKRIGVVGIPGNIHGRAIAGNELVSALVKLRGQLPVE